MENTKETNNQTMSETISNIWTFTINNSTELEHSKHKANLLSLDITLMNSLFLGEGIFFTCDSPNVNFKAHFTMKGVIDFGFPTTGAAAISFIKTEDGIGHHRNYWTNHTPKIIIGTLYDNSFSNAHRQMITNQPEINATYETKRLTRPSSLRHHKSFISNLSEASD